MAHRFTSPVQPEEMSSDLPSSDPEDADYHPGINDHPRIASLLDVMLVPQSRRITMSTTPSEKQKARESDPKDGRCLVSNESDPSCAIEVCHILPKATGAELLTALEWSWGQQYWSLDIHSSKNLCFQMRNFHVAFDSGWWMLLPTLNWIQAFERLPIPPPKMITSMYGSTTVFQYRIVALPQMEDVVIHYRTFDQNPTRSRPNLRAHYYPYDTLGVISSHVQPHFVICNTGQKLKNLSSFGLTTAQLRTPPTTSTDPFGNIVQSLLSVQVIYLKWSTAPPAEGFKQFTFSGRRSGKAEKDDLWDNVLSDDAYHSAHSTRSTRSKNNRANTVQPRDLDQDQLTYSSLAYDEPVTGNDTLRAGTQMHGWNIKEWAAHVSMNGRHGEEHSNGQYDHDVCALPSHLLLTV